MINEVIYSSIKTKANHYLLYYILIIYILQIFCVNVITLKSQRILINNKSEINIVIEGSGNQKILSSYYKGVNPSKVLVNGKEDSSCSTTCKLKDPKSNITLIFNDPFDSLYEMFRGLTNIIEVDLSKFDTSKLTNMIRIFYDCQKLKKIYFGNFKTKSVTNMRSLFKGCSSLISLDLSKFDTSNNTSLHQWFYGCKSLKYIDLSNFNTSKVIEMGKMFNNCSSLIYLNLKSFKLKGSVILDNAFDGISTYAIYCVNDATLLNNLPEKANKDCSHDCFKENIKVDIKNNICVKSCINKKYEENNACLNECEIGFYPLFCEEEDCDNEFECLKEARQGYYFDSNDKVFKKCFKNCYDCYGPGNEIDNNCISCKNNFTFLKEFINNNNCYEKCKYYYYFDKDKYYCTSNEKCPQKCSKLIIPKNRCIDDCKYDKNYQYEYNNSCLEECPLGTNPNKDNKICIENNKEQIMTEITPKIKSEFNKEIKTDFIQDIKDEFLQDIKENIKEGFNTTEIDKGNDTIYIKDNIIYTITSTSNQKNNKNKSNISSIDLGECEDILKKEYNISINDSLYILKIDALIGKMNKVEYEVYYPFFPNKLTKLNLSKCRNKKVDIRIPVDISPKEIDKYNKSSEMYNNICYTLKSENGTDKPLEDRKNEFVKYNMSLCEEDCDFTDYDSINKKAICSCLIKLKLPLISEIKIDKDKLISNFKDIKNIANFKLLNCYYLIFDKNNISKNLSNYTTTILIIFSIVSIFSFICHDYIKAKNIINQFERNKKRNNTIIKNILTNNIKNKKKLTNNNNILTQNNNNQRNVRKNLSNVKKNNKRFSNLPFGYQFCNLNFNKNIKRQSAIKKFNNPKESNNKIKNIRLEHKRNSIINQKRGNTSTFVNSNYQMKRKLNGNNNNKLNLNNDKEKNESYNDYELNMLNYEDAKRLDYRSYCQYYISLLRTKHILIFSFFHHNDYNSQVIKIYLFFFTFEINFLISAMFYSDSIIHKIYVENGSFDFTYQIPQMFYSFIVSTILKNILNILGLYEPNVVLIKNDKSANKDIQNDLNNIKCKIFLFFVCTYIILSFSWIYLGCFCAVYKNTQIHLLKQVCSSLIVSFFTPFFIYLIPGVFRIKSLKNKTKSPILFKISKFLQLF